MSKQIFVRVNGIDKDLRDTTEIERYNSLYPNLSSGQIASLLEKVLANVNKND